MWWALCVLPAVTLVTWISRVCEMAELHKSARCPEVISRPGGIYQSVDSWRKEGDVAVVERAPLLKSIRFVPTLLITNCRSCFERSAR
jgi:hypothetical protein